MLSWIFIVLAHWNNSSRADMSFHPNSFICCSVTTSFCSHLKTSQKGCPLVWHDKSNTEPTHKTWRTSDVLGEWHTQYTSRQLIGWRPIVNYGLVWFMAVIATLNNISIISWRSVLLVETTGVPRENHRSATSHWQTLSHNVVSSIQMYILDTNLYLSRVMIVQQDFFLFCFPLVKYRCWTIRLTERSREK